jgi:phosphate uptake regulator
MKRKIIKQASQAYTITLPIEWVRKNKLDKKSEVEISESGKSLIITTDKPTEGGTVQLEIKDEIDIRNLYLHINALYAKGIDKLEIIYNGDISSEIIICLNSLLGYALISKNNNTYVIKDIGGGNYSGLDEIFKRVFQMILLFYDDASKDILGKQQEKLENLKNRDKEINKFCLFLQRAINKMFYPDSVDGRTLFTYSFALEEIGDEIFRLWKSNIENKFKIDAELIALINLCKAGLEEAFDIYYQFSSKRVEKIYHIRESIRNKAANIKKIDTKKAIFIGHIIKIIDEAADLRHLTLMMRLK